MKYLVTTVIMLTVAVYSNTAFAWEANKPYIKTSVGQFKFSGATSLSLHDPSGNLIFIEFDDDTIGFDTNVGFPFSNNLAIEGGFSYLTESDWKVRGVVGTISGTTDGYALTVAIVSRIPISNNFGLLGKFGVYHWEVELTETTGTGFSEENDDTEVLTGFGLDFRINKTTSFVAGYDVYDEALNFAHIGLRFNL